MDKELKPPKQIWYSLYAFLCTIPVVIGDFLLSVFVHKVDLKLWNIKVYLLDLAITMLIMLLIFRRKNLARIVYTILTGLTVFGAFWITKGVIYIGPYNIISLSIQVTLRLVSVYFLFVKQSREWFNPSCAEYIADQLGINESVVYKSVASPSCPELIPSIPETKMSTQLRYKLKEKKRFLFAVGIILCVCLLISIFYFGRRAVMIGAIRSTLSSDVALNRQIFGNRSSNDCDSDTIEAYAQGLRGIDMSRCPRDFQLAYLDHIHAWESLARSRASLNLGSLILSLAQKTIPSIPDEQPIQDEIKRTWEKVERIALSYGVRVTE